MGQLQKKKFHNWIIIHTNYMSYCSGNYNLSGLFFKVKRKNNACGAWSGKSPAFLTKPCAEVKHDTV